MGKSSPCELGLRALLDAMRRVRIEAFSQVKFDALRQLQGNVHGFPFSDMTEKEKAPPKRGFFMQQ